VSVNVIIAARANGKFQSFFDFVMRCEAGSFNKKVLESLVCAGAIDSLRPSGQTVARWRANLYHAVDSTLARASRFRRDQSRGQNMLFGASGTEALHDASSDWIENVPAWTPSELLAAEKRAIGFYITGHPLENYSEVLKELRCCQVSELYNLAPGSKVSLGAIVTELQVRTTKSGNNFAILRLEDQTGGVKCVCWPEAHSKYGVFLKTDAPVLVSCKVEMAEEGSLTLVADEVARLEGVLQQKSRAVVVRVPTGVGLDEILETLFETLDRSRGDCEIFLDFLLDDGLMVRVRPHTTLRVQGSLELETILLKYGCQVEWLNAA